MGSILIRDWNTVRLRPGNHSHQGGRQTRSKNDGGESIATG
ncbi:hypothetical protein TRICHSKD4_1344 [Roseibium sp. TrichSKD4]|nr:hypothetical protein TRICHSKD4_1344 [Roseibium sp. TrichSKD4]